MEASEEKEYVQEYEEEVVEEVLSLFFCRVMVYVFRVLRV